MMQILICENFHLGMAIGRVVTLWWLLTLCLQVEDEPFDWIETLGTAKE